MSCFMTQVLSCGIFQTLMNAERIRVDVQMVSVVIPLVVISATAMMDTNERLMAKVVKVSEIR